MIDTKIYTNHLPNRKLISLFAGAGGLDLGLEMAGFHTVIANELEPHACETLRRNQRLGKLEGEEIDEFIEKALQQKCYSRLRSNKGQKFFQRLRSTEKRPYLQGANIVEGDIRDIPSSFFKEAMSDNEVFAIAGGPPCQPFSKAGKQKSLDCTKNGDLFYEFVRLVTDLKPKWFIFENVKGITFTKTDVLYVMCKNCTHMELAPFKTRQDWKMDVQPEGHCSKCQAKALGWHVKNEAGGSLKIIVNEFEKAGYTCDTKVLNAADYGAPQIRERLFIVGNTDGKYFEWPEPTNISSKNSHYVPSLFDAPRTMKPWRSMYDAIWQNGHFKYGVLNKEEAVLWVKNVVRPHDEPVTWHLDRPSPTIGAHQSAKLALAPTGVPEKQIYRQQWHTKGRRQGDTPPVPVEHEYLSDEELLKLQTFPSWWYLHGTRMQRAFQIGNAVPPILAYHVGNAVINTELKYEYEHPSGLYKNRV